MATSNLGIYELLAPQFLAGFTFPGYIDEYLSKLGIDSLRMAIDDRVVVYVGVVSFAPNTNRQHRDPSGAVFDINEISISFRLTIPRDGAAFVNDAINSPALPLPELDNLFDRLGAIDQTTTTATEYPGVRFRLELMLSALTFHMGSEWVPGKVQGASIVRNDDPEFRGQDVKFALPKMVLQYEQGDDLTVPPVFQVNSWGNAGFNAPHDLAQGEIVRMEPAIALHESGRLAFGVDQILVDLSEASTPAEILAFFGADESFRGLFLKSLRFFYLDENRMGGVNIAVNDALISFKGEISLEASVDVLMSASLGGRLSVTVKFYNGETAIEYTQSRETSSLIFSGGRTTVPQTAIAHLEISGGIPDYDVQVTLNGENIWNATERKAFISPGMSGTTPTLRSVGEYTLVVRVQDNVGSAPAGSPPPTPSIYTNTITVNVTEAERLLPPVERDGSAGDRSPEPGAFQNATFTVTTPPTRSGYSIRRATPTANSETETLIVTGGDRATVRILRSGTTISTRELSGSDRQISFDVPHGTNFDVEATYPATIPGATEEIKLLFDNNKPSASGWGTLGSSSSRSSYANATASDTQFTSTRPALISRLQSGFPTGTTVDLLATASFERNEREPEDQNLSSRRLDVALDLIAANPSSGVMIGTTSATGFTNARSAVIGGDTSRRADPNDRAVTFTFRPPSQGADSAQATISRPARPASTPSSTPTGTPIVQNSPPASSPPARRPPVIKRLSFRVRLERNVPVLLELSGQLDFETELEQRLRQGGATNPGTASAASGDLSLTNQNDGLVDFKINVTYDTATKQLNETLSLNAAPADIDGLLQMQNNRAEGASRTGDMVLKDIFGSLLTFAPVINSATTAATTRGTEADWVAMGVSIGVPVAISALDVFRTQKVTLFGGEMRFRQYLPAGTDPLRFTDAGIVFDYGVEFGVVIQSLGIRTTRPLKVRYKAIGFNLHFDGGVSYQPIFDASKGYEINLSDPGLFNLPSPLGDWLKIASARIARFNPLTLELDFALKVDLGVVTVDRFKVKLPLDPIGTPMIMPTGARVNIPATLQGSGFVNIIERIKPTGIEKGIEGGLDITVVPVRLRIAASLGVINVTQGERKAVAVYAGLIAEFPAPIPLWASGIGLYGFSGLFAMHYKRTEDLPVPGASAGPALKWLIKAEGDPARLQTGTGIQLWDTELDRWSFGVGVILGTIDGGFVMNFRGMFVLELPGPRILIFVKIQIIAKLPDLKPAADLEVGILGVIDLDIGRGQLTIGVMVNLAIENLIEVALPIEIFFKFNDIKQFHLYIGTQLQPASALVLNIVRARGYFMIDGTQIAPFPPPDGAGLPGLAVATGIEASIVFGNTDIGLYLRVAAGAHLGVAFSPLFIVGQIYLTGELRIFIVSIEADGRLDVEAPDPTYVHGKICGRVDFFFFSVEGCVEISIGSNVRSLPAPALIRGVYLQSFAPVITAGQGGDKPIDASLGDAVMLRPDGSLPPGITPDKLPSVPIDSVPVIQFHASPILGSGFTTFTAPLNTAPGLTPDGWIDVGGGRQVRYILKETSLSATPSAPAFSSPPPATWRKDTAPGGDGVKTNIDLALFSRVPFVAPRALERSTELTELVEQRWSNLCQPIAPPTCVLWTWCGQPLGISGSGWHLQGIPQPDPPGTRRSTPPNPHLYVEEPAVAAGDAILDQLMGDLGQPTTTPARVIGVNPNRDRDRQIGKTCVIYSQQQPGQSKNPRNESFGRVLVLDSAGEPLQATRFAVLSNFIGLDVGFTTQLEFRLAVCDVELTLVHFSRPAIVTAFDEEGNAIDKVDMNREGKVPQTLRLQGKNIQRIQIEAPANETLLLSICTELCSPQEKIENVNCYRALQLPSIVSTPLPQQEQLPEEALEYLKKQSPNTFITLHTGEATFVRAFFSVFARATDAIFIRELDAENNLIQEYRLVDRSPTWITGTTTNLPAEWLAPPWVTGITAVANFLADTQFSGMQRGWVELKPSEKCTKIQIAIADKNNYQTIHVFILGAIQVCSRLEAIRAATDESIRTGEIKTVQDYLNGGDLVPSLAPNRTYTLTIRYDAESKAEDGSITTESDLIQRAQFRTDAEEPSRLESYVLGTTPMHEDQFHFCDDPIKVVFNDRSTIQLYNAYGKKLRIIVRAADGAPYPQDEIKTLTPIMGSISTPFREALEQLAKQGKIPCTGSILTPSHGSYTSLVKLRPLMAYTLDIELDPPNPDTTLPSGNPAPKVPLYRRQFTTSRYGSMAELIADLKTKRIRHRALTAPVTLTGRLVSGIVSMATDIEIQTALVTAGEQALPAPEETGITIYWAQRPGQVNFSPHVIMIDAAEPLWRSRSTPVLEVVRDADGSVIDPAFMRALPGTQVSLELRERAGSSITRFVRSTSGTRTLAFLSNTFSPPVTGSEVTLELHRPESSLYQISDLAQDLIALWLTSIAPWEEDQP